MESANLEVELQSVVLDSTLPANRQSTQSTVLTTVLRVVLVTIAIAHITYYLVRTFDLRDRDSAEGPLLAMVERMRTEPVSRHWQYRPEFTLSCYGPGYYWAVMAVSPLTPWDHTLIPGRLVSLAAIVASCLMLMIFVWRESRNLDAALLAAMMFLAAPALFKWGTYHRVDDLALFFSLASVACFGPSTRRLFITAILIVIGSLVRQTVALVALPMFLFLLFDRKYAQAARFAIVVWVLGIGAWLAVDQFSGGYFLDAALRGNYAPMHLVNGLRQEFWLVRTPVVIAAFAALAYRYMSGARRPFSLFPYLAFLTSVCLSCVLISKEGSAVNYFLEPSALAAAVTAIGGAAPLLDRFGRRAIPPLALACALCAVPAFFELNRARAAGFGNPAEYKIVRELVEQTPRDAEILSDDILVDAVVRTGRRPLVNDPFVFRLRSAAGYLDSSLLTSRMRQGTIGLILMHKPLAQQHSGWPWPQSILDVVAAQYHLASAADAVYAYRHIAEAAGSRAAGGVQNDR